MKRLCFPIGGFALLAALGAASPSPAQTASCYCAKADPNDAAAKHCGELLTLSEATIRLREKGHNIALDPLEYVGCAAPKEAAAGQAGPGNAAQAARTEPRGPEPRGPEPRGTEPRGTDTAGGGKMTAPPPSSPVQIVQPEEFGVAGSNTIGEKLMGDLIAGYGEKNGWTLGDRQCRGPIRLKAPNGQALTIRCAAHGSGTGVPALLAKTADIAMLSRPIDETEKGGFPYPMDTPPQETVLALDGLLILVAPNNPVRSLSLAEIARVFSGEISDWAQLGGPAGAINLYARDTKSGTRDTFDFLVMQPYARKMSPRAQLYESSSELANGVARDPRGIGFAGFAYGGGQTKRLEIRGECGIVHAPSVFAIKTEDYPLARRLFLYKPKGVHSAHSQHLVDYALSNEAQKIIAGAGYVDQRIEPQTTEETSRRIAAYQKAPPREPGLETDPALTRELAAYAKTAKRLSITFRFRVNSHALDSKAWQDAVRFAGLLQKHAPGGTVLLAGFADAQGPWPHNLALARQRAEEVRRVLLASGTGLSPDSLLAKGYGEIIPVSCNGDSAGRTKNRRVEVWLLGDRNDRHVNR